MNGAVRQTVQVPQHEVYNPPSSQSSALGRAGAQIYGSGFAGRPLRGLEKEFGKKVVPDSSYYQGALGMPTSSFKEAYGQSPSPTAYQS